ncbi:MAG: BON domain-containing protein [Candidatus Thioglobus sp.]|uniref:BON domain-containing protein n=1 Tax=Candidatus Thioglobus sp. TaxID=2026721 RepID=UPI00263245A2|nr:BON domain-containing protein [Candidatus Thioglobus sp.]MDC9726886.1 BON domain-containing protein [Candidatus Thioglobus sp.]
MKKIILSALLLTNTFLLSGCLPVIQGASTVSTVITVSNDRRTAGEVLDDRTIAFRLFAWPSTDVALEDAHLNFMVYDKNVLITGEAASSNLRNYAAKQAQLQDAKITQVFNEINVGPNSGLLSRAKDSAITLQVEALFHDQEVFHPTHIRVMTENQTVYLMGAVTKREADKAVKVASKAKGVKKVVKLFKYLKTRPAAEIERDRQRELAAQKEAELRKQQAALDAQKAKLKQELKALGGSAEGTPF